ncbi:serine/threonine-protein phosphatase 6 regulatory subunit 1 isoform X3 [Antechinus flavipes]|uniref:serine/threonine-protein phosphatase 6 regulatory subunit 1 isoform X3 n=1 Tax=Antechinus flavipes TaxID=38775 RepID=UPI002235E353|nr:serine/threonine-protein phosphatase 6 regulatory subunit 1 isoform X3 [Antechinus flavipes]
MFWKFDLHTSSHIDTLLQREDLALPELLDEEDVLQECKVLHPKLLDFLLRPAHLQALVDWVTQEPPAVGDERLRYKYPSVSCEILTSDVPQINDALAEDEALLDRLYGFLQNRDPLNPLLASFFSKVMGILINRKTDQIVSFLRKKADFVSLLLHHIGTSAIMDLLLRLLTCVEQPPLRQEVFNWLNEERIVERLIDMIHPDRDEGQHSNAAQSLCDIVRLSREQMLPTRDPAEPERLLATLEKQETIERLLGNMFGSDQNESVIVSGIQVILTLLEPRRPRAEAGGVGGFAVDGQLELVPPGGPESPPRGQANLGTLRALRQWLSHFHRLLLEPPTETLRTTWGSLQPPLGNTRLHVVKLLASALSANNPALTGELLGMDTLNAMLDLFFTYVFNNFLHAQVETWVSSVLGAAPAGGEEGPEAPDPNPAVRHLLQKCRLVERILGAWEENDREQSEGGRRKGYMGHLTRIANAVVQSAEKGPNAALVGQLLPEVLGEQQQVWEKFVSGPLSETNQKNAVDLVSTHNLHCSSDEEEERLKGFAFPQEAVLQQAFMDFQMQQMTSAFVEHFGFNDEEFGEQEENVNAPFDKTASITFSLSADDESPNASLFELCCKERLHQFEEEEEEEGLGSGDSDGEEAIWQDGQRGRTVRSSGSTDSEEEDEEEEEEEEEASGTMGGLSPPAFTFPHPESPGPPPRAPRKRIPSAPLRASLDPRPGPPGSPDAQHVGTAPDRVRGPPPLAAARAPREPTDAKGARCPRQAPSRPAATLRETRDPLRASGQDSGEPPSSPSGPAPGGPPPPADTK